MISFKEAKNIVQNAARGQIFSQEAIPVAEINGRVCARQVLAPFDIQPFDNSSMDGFAVICDDLIQASTVNPVMLQNVAIIPAGNGKPNQALQTGQCCHIMTGAPIPLGADAVVPIERISQEGERIVFQERPIKNANIRFSGEDFKQGDGLINPGDYLTTKHILPLTTLGIEKVDVFKMPRAAFLATGQELIDDLSAPLEFGQIYNANKPYAIAQLSSMGVDCVQALTIRDDPVDFLKVLESFNDLNLDVIISSGAVSAGEFDFVKAGLEKSGAEILYHKIKLKPGKPNLLARLPNGTLYFGLPGNPVANAVGLRFFIGDIVRAFFQQEPEKPSYAISQNGFSKKPGLHMILKGRSESRKNGTLMVEFLEGQASFMVSPFLNMNCWIHIPEEVSEIKSGDIVTVYPLLSR